MTASQVTFVTISCDGPGCDKSVTFPATEQGQGEAHHDNPWLNSHRAVQTPDGRKLGYCSDQCEAEAIKLGNHNKLEQRVTEATTGDVALAAKAAEMAKKQQDAIKAGRPAQVSLA